MDTVPVHGYCPMVERSRMARTTDRPERRTLRLDVIVGWHFGRRRAGWHPYGTAPAVRVGYLVSGDSEEPGTETRPGAEPGQPVDRVAEGLLGEVEGLFRIGHTGTD